MDKRFSKVEQRLVEAGIAITKSKVGMFGTYVIGRYPIGEKHILIGLVFHSLFRSLEAKLIIPYSPLKGPLQDEYDRLFPEEKTMWGRSTPKFEQAVIDYMRGQGGNGNVVELRKGKSELYIELHVDCNGESGQEGFLLGIEKVSFELRKGPLHQDVLTHMFAY